MIYRVVNYYQGSVSHDIEAESKDQAIDLAHTADNSLSDTSLRLMLENFEISDTMVLEDE